MDEERKPSPVGLAVNESIRPDFLGGSSSRESASPSAAENLGAIEKAASDGDLLEKKDNGLDEAKETERSGGFFTGSGKSDDKNKKKKGKFKGGFKKKGPIVTIIMSVVGIGGMIGGAQTLMPFAIQEMIIEKFNSIGISSTMASDSWLDTQLNQDVRVGNLESGTTGASLFAFSEYQVNQFESQGIKVVSNVGNLTQMTALLYKKGDMYIPVIGSDMMRYPTSDVVNAIKAASGLDNIGNPVSAKEALSDPDFKTPYTAASKTWRGGSSGWFDGIMSSITEQKLNISRNRWSKYISKGLSSASEKIRAEFKETASGKGKIKDDGVAEFFDEEKTGDDGKPVTTETKTNLDGDDITVKPSEKLTKIQNVLNNKAVKAGQTVANAGCALVKAVMAIHATASAYQSLQFLNLVTGFLESVGKVKAGFGNDSPMNIYAENLTVATDTFDGEGKKVASGKTAMASAGMSWLFSDNATINSNDASVQNVNFEAIMNRVTEFSSDITNLSRTMVTCGYIKMASSAVDFAADAIMLATTGGIGNVVKILVKKAATTIAAGAISMVISGFVGKFIKSIVNSIIEDAATEWLGEDLGNALLSGAGKYLGGNGTSGGQSPTGIEKLAEYTVEKNAIIAEEAEYQRKVRSPFDVASPYTFLGSIAYSMMPLRYSGYSIMPVISSTSSILSSSLVGMMPTVSAIDEATAARSRGDCPLLDSYGIIGDAFCNAYIITDTSTIGYSPVAIQNIVRELNADGVIAANGGYESKISSNLEDDGSIKKGSELSKYIVYCGQRTSQYGVYDTNIAQSASGEDTMVSKIFGSVPVIDNLTNIVTGIKEQNNIDWVTGNACAATNENDKWESEYKYYQRYAENERLLESMNPGYKSKVTAFMEDYYKENPLDHSFEGTIARFSGMSKDEVEDTLALIDYYRFLNEYDASERYAFGEPAVKDDGKMDFSNGNKIAEMPFMLLNEISFADVRNRSFAV